MYLFKKKKKIIIIIYLFIARLFVRLFVKVLVCLVHCNLINGISHSYEGVVRLPPSTPPPPDIQHHHPIPYTNRPERRDDSYIHVTIH